MPIVSIFAAISLAAPPAPAAPALPERSEVEQALNDLERCRGLTGPDCPPPLRRYTVHRSECMAIPPEEGRRAAACRVDLTLTYADPAVETTRHHDSCVRFGERAGSGGGASWAVLQIRDRPCEMSTRLTEDPNPVPRRAELESALNRRPICLDPDGLAHCGSSGIGPLIVERFRCRPIAAGEEGRARAACRVTRSLGGFRLGLEHLRNECVRLERTTPADRSPAYWIRIEGQPGARCEVRRLPDRGWTGSPSR